MDTLWGIDLGGTKTEGVVLDPNGTVLHRERIPTEADKGYDHIISRIQKLSDLLETAVHQKPKIIGVGTPGVLDPITCTLKNSNTLCLNSRSLKGDIEKALGIEALLANDANCFALAESRLGASKGAKVTFGVIMGTGVGGGIVIDGKILEGKQGIAGEWGHNVLDPAGKACYCGKLGCVETVLSGPALEQHYHEISGKKLTLAEIFAEFKQGHNSFATEIANRLVQNFGRALSVVINILDPDVVVLGGGLSNIDILYTLGLLELQKNVFNTRLETILVKNALGDSAGVFGAALLCEKGRHI